MSAKKDMRTLVERCSHDHHAHFSARSTKRIGNLSPNLSLFYAPSFTSQAQTITKNAGMFYEDLAKLHRCALTYGYRGRSGGKQNGIVDITPTNHSLLRAYENRLSQEVIQTYELLQENLHPVKVVAHVPHGNRLVGALDTTQGDFHKVVILCMANYNGKIRASR
jgi:hypothetical protein